jgi:hypothetical protein
MRRAPAPVLLSLLVLAACSKPARGTSSSVAASSTAASPAAAALPATAAAAPDEANAPADEEGQFGSLVDEQEFSSAVAVLPPSALRDPPAARPPLPPRVLLANLPAVATQGTAAHRGSPGSCEAQSFGYALGAYTAARSPDGRKLWDASLPENQPSAAFLYAWQHKITGKTCPTGSGGTPYLARLVSLGAPSAADVPYEPNCQYLAGAGYLDKAYPSEARLRLGSFATFHLGPAELPLVKELLAAGQAIAFSGPVLKGYGQPQLEDGVLYSSVTVPKSGHGQLIVGYDDTKGRAAKPGAFLVQNSEGQDWPSNAGGGGRIWIAYETFLGTQKLAATAYPRDPSAPTGQPLKAVPAAAPTASITRAFQFAEGAGPTYLVLLHHFAEPVLLKSIVLLEPGGTTVVATLNQFVQSGYTHVRRTDGEAFMTGNWNVTLVGEDAAGASVTYTGTVALGPSSPLARPAGRVTMATLGPTGAIAGVR